MHACCVWHVASNFILCQPRLNLLTTEQVPNVREVEDRIPDLCDVHKDKVMKIIKKCFAQYGLTIDGKPLFAEAECVVIRLVHKTTWKIIELIIHLALYATSLNGEAIAKHILDAMNGHNLDGKFWRAVMLDRAATNKRSLVLVKGKKNWKPLSVYCISHGYSGCGKKHKMNTAKKVLKQLTKMVQHKLCKARTFFRSLYNEAPRKGGGVRWGIELEHCEQVNRLGLGELIEKYVKPCVAEAYSEKSSKKLIKAVKEPQEMAKAIVEIAAVVDAGTPLIQNCYNCETKQPIVFVLSSIVRDMDDSYGAGVDEYIFDELQIKAKEAAEIMKKNMVSSRMSHLTVCSTVDLICRRAAFLRNQ